MMLVVNAAMLSWQEFLELPQVGLKIPLPKQCRRETINDEEEENDKKKKVMTTKLVENQQEILSWNCMVKKHLQWKSRGK